MQFQLGRVLQYVQESSDQLPTSLMTSTNQTLSEINETNLGATNVAAAAVDRKVTFFMDELLGQYFIDYVNLVKGLIVKNVEK